MDRVLSFVITSVGLTACVTLDAEPTSTTSHPISLYAGKPFPADVSARTYPVLAMRFTDGSFLRVGEFPSGLPMPPPGGETLAACGNPHQGTRFSARYHLRSATGEDLLVYDGKESDPPTIERPWMVFKGDRLAGVVTDYPLGQLPLNDGAEATFASLNARFDPSVTVQRECYQYEVPSQSFQSSPLDGLVWGILGVALAPVGVPLAVIDRAMNDPDYQDADEKVYVPPAPGQPIEASPEDVFGPIGRRFKVLPLKDQPGHSVVVVELEGYRDQFRETPIAAYGLEGDLVLWSLNRDAAWQICPMLTDMDRERHCRINKDRTAFAAAPRPIQKVFKF